MHRWLLKGFLLSNLEYYPLSGMNAYLDLVHKFGAHNNNFIASLIGNVL